MVTALAATQLAGCSPALNWRQVRPEGWGLVATLPCRPDQQERAVSLAGAPVVLGMWVCSADGHTFALASADMGDPGRVAPALQALTQAAQANIRGRIDAEQPAAVVGMTPHAASVLRRLSGQLPDGQPVHEQVLVFANGLRVFQATVVGPIVSEAQAGPFFESLGLPR